MATFFRLQHLLNLFMVRHTKQDIDQLHKPVFTMTRTVMSADENQAYDTLVSAVQINLITTAMKGKTSGLQDSLLHRSQVTHAKKALNNIRLACSGGTKIVPTLTQTNWDLTLKIMRDTHKADDIAITLVKQFLKRMTEEEKSSCMCCGVELQTMFLLPCACQICTECMNSETKECPNSNCRKAFDIDEFQKLQPGLDYTWKWNIIEAQKEREEQRMMAESISLQFASTQSENGGNLDIVQNIVDNEQQQPLQLEQQQQQQRHSRGRKHPHICRYPDTYRDGKCLICSEIHQCNFMKYRKCNVCHSVAEDCPQNESKAYYITEKLLELWYMYQSRGKDEVTGNKKRPLKVIIFTQFQQVSNLVGDRLIRRFGTECVAEYWGSTRNLELERFSKIQNDHRRKLKKIRRLQFE